MGSGKGCGITILKWLLIIFNILFMLLGLGVLIVGAYVTHQVRTLAITEVSGVGIALIIVGVVTLFIGFLGCMGACKQNKCMLYTFAIIIVLIFIFEIVVGIVAFVYRGTVEDQVDKYLSNEYKEIVSLNNDKIAGAVAIFQEQFSCCGYDNVTAHQITNATFETKGGNFKVLRDSCFPDKDPSMARFPSCKEKIVDNVKQYYVYVGVIGVVFALIQLLGVVFACCVARHEDLDKMA